MSDIVDRLHKVDGLHKETARQAVIEIEILRIEKAEAVRQRNADEMQKMIDYWGARAEKAEAEIERLRALQRGYLDEIDRLRRTAGEPKP